MLYTAPKIEPYLIPKGECGAYQTYAMFTSGQGENEREHGVFHFEFILPFGLIVRLIIQLDLSFMSPALGDYSLSHSLLWAVIPSTVTSLGDVSLLRPLLWAINYSSVSALGDDSLLHPLLWAINAPPQSTVTALGDDSFFMSPALGNHSLHGHYFERPTPLNNS